MGFRSLLQLVREGCGCQSSWPTWAGIGGKPLAVWGYFQNVLKEERSCTRHAGGITQISGVPNWIKRKKRAVHGPAFICFYIMIEDLRWPATTYYCSHAIPIIMDCMPQTVSWKKKSFLKLLFLGILSWQWEKSWIHYLFLPLERENTMHRILYVPTCSSAYTIPWVFKQPLEVFISKSWPFL